MAKLSFELPDSNFYVEVRFLPHSVDVKPGDPAREFKVYCTVAPHDDVVIKPNFPNESE